MKCTICNEEKTESFLLNAKWVCEECRNAMIGHSSFSKEKFELLKIVTEKCLQKESMPEEYLQNRLSIIINSVTDRIWNDFIKEENK